MGDGGGGESVEQKCNHFYFRPIFYLRESNQSIVTSVYIIGDLGILFKGWGYSEVMSLQISHYYDRVRPAL